MLRKFDTSEICTLRISVGTRTAEITWINFCELLAKIANITFIVTSLSAAIARQEHSILFLMYGDNRKDNVQRTNEQEKIPVQLISVLSEDFSIFNVNL